MQKKTPMLVTSSIKNKTYKQLIEYAFKKCDAVMFVTTQRFFESKHYRGDPKDKIILEQTIKNIEENFKNDFLKKRTNSQFVIDEYKDGKTNRVFNDGFGVYFYTFNKELKDYLLSNTDLYKWNNPHYPENVSLFKDGYCWLSSISHESMCWIYVADKKEFQYLKSIGIEFWQKEFVPTPKKDLYFEKY